MAKSAGNVYKLRELVEMGYAPEAIRFLLAQVPYRKKLNFTFDQLKAAGQSIERMRNYALRLKTGKYPEGFSEALAGRARTAIIQFDEAMDDDLNTAEALAAAFEYVRETNTMMDQGGFPAGNVPDAEAVLARFDSVFDVLRVTAAADALSDAEIDALAAERTQAKKHRNFARADAIRAELLAKGVVIEDTKDGVRWKRK
jgi:cysteinyl-tRNA synthetase